jgi:hypothetical protein
VLRMGFVDLPNLPVPFLKCNLLLLWFASHCLYWYLLTLLHQDPQFDVDETRPGSAFPNSNPRLADQRDVGLRSAADVDFVAARVFR